MIRRYTLTAQLPALEGENLPTEFRIFKAGVNESSKGPALFDAEAAREVMARYQREGVDVPVDLNHDSFDTPIRPDMGDARGWFKLELRNGELWAVDVKWTPDGARRLREKTQRYISPAFDLDEATNRVLGLWNVALVAMPATYRAEPLVAASRQTREAPKTPAPILTEEDFMRALSEVVGLAHYPWEQCISDQLAAGHSQDSAAKICGSIKAQNQGKLLEQLAATIAAKPSAEVSATLSRITGAPLAWVFAAASLRFAARMTSVNAERSKAYTLLRKAKAMK